MIYDFSFWLQMSLILIHSGLLWVCYKSKYDDHQNSTERRCFFPYPTRYADDDAPCRWSCPDYCKPIYHRIIIHHERLKPLCWFVIVFSCVSIAHAITAIFKWKGFHDFLFSAMPEPLDKFFVTFLILTMPMFLIHGNSFFENLEITFIGKNSRSWSTKRLGFSRPCGRRGLLKEVSQDELPALGFFLLPGQFYIYTSIFALASTPILFFLSDDSLIRKTITIVFTIQIVVIILDFMATLWRERFIRQAGKKYWVENLESHFYAHVYDKWFKSNELEKVEQLHQQKIERREKNATRASKERTERDKARAEYFPEDEAKEKTPEEKLEKMKSKFQTVIANADASGAYTVLKNKLHYYPQLDNLDVSSTLIEVVLNQEIKNFDEILEVLVDTTNRSLWNETILARFFIKAAQYEKSIIPTLNHLARVSRGRSFSSNHAAILKTFDSKTWLIQQQSEEVMVNIERVLLSDEMIAYIVKHSILSSGYDPITLSDLIYTFSTWFDPETGESLAIKLIDTALKEYSKTAKFQLKPQLSESITGLLLQNYPENINNMWDARDIACSEWRVTASVLREILQTSHFGPHDQKPYRNWIQGAAILDGAIWRDPPLVLLLRHDDTLGLKDGTLYEYTKEKVQCYIEICQTFEAYDRFGKTILQILYDNEQVKNERIIDCIEYGIPIDLPDLEGRTLIWHAKNKGDKKFVDMLEELEQKLCLQKPDLPDIVAEKPDQPQTIQETHQPSKTLIRQQIPLTQNLETLFNFNLPQKGMVLFLGDSSSGVKEYLNELKKNRRTYEIRSGSLVSTEAYNQLVGSAKGYVGSDSPTKFIEWARMNPTGTVIVENIGSVLSPASLLSEFISMISSGKINDKTETYTSISSHEMTVIFTLSEEIVSAQRLSEDQLRNYLLDKVTSNGHKVPEQLVIEARCLASFSSFSEHPESISNRFSKGFHSSVGDNLSVASDLFSLTNRELLQLHDKTLEIQNSSGILKLLADQQSFKEVERINKGHYKKFIENLDGYFGQEEAVMALDLILISKITEIESLLSDAINKGQLTQHDKRNKPVSLLCVGPPGIGKTELAKRLGSSLSSYVRIDCNTINHSADIFGNSHTPGELGKKLMKNVPCVVVFDEIEKLNLQIIESLYQLLDEGRFVDRHNNETYTVRDAFFLFTSNLTENPDIEATDAKKIAASVLGSPFVDRIKDVVPFRRFSEDQLLEIAKGFASDIDYVIREEDVREIKKAESIRELPNILSKLKAVSVREQFRKEAMDS